MRRDAPEMPRISVFRDAPEMLLQMLVLQCTLLPTTPKCPHTALIGLRSRLPFPITDCHSKYRFMRWCCSDPSPDLLKFADDAARQVGEPETAEVGVADGETTLAPT